MNVKFYTADLEEQLRKYCSSTDRSMNSVVNEAVSGFFSVSPNAKNSDIGDRFRAVIALSHGIDFAEFEHLLDVVRQDALTQNAEMADLLTSAISEGFTQLKARYKL